MTGPTGADRPDGLTDAQLDQLLNAVNEELLDRIKATADSSATLAAITADSTLETSHPRAAASARIKAVIAISERIRAKELGGALEEPLARFRDLNDGYLVLVRPYSVSGHRFPGLVRILRYRLLYTARSHRGLLYLGGLLGWWAFFLAGVSLRFFPLTWLGFAIFVAGTAGIFTGWFVRMPLYRVRRAAFASALVLAQFAVRRLARGFTRTVTTGSRSAPTSGRERGIARAFARARIRDQLFARIIDLALDRGSRFKFHDRTRVMSIKRELDRLRDFISTVEGQPVDASGADLLHVRIGDLSALGGVIWTRQTTWPPGIADAVRRESDMILDGVYQIRAGNSPDRSSLTQV